MKLTVPKGELILPEDFSFELTFNHPFFSDEGSSSIPVEIPACPENMAMLDYPSRLGSTQPKTTSFSAILSHGLFQLEGTLIVGGVSSDGGISCTFASRESVLYAELQDKSLKDLFSKKTIALGGDDPYVAYTTIDSMWAANCDEFLDASGKVIPGLTAFPVEVTADEFGFRVVNKLNAGKNGFIGEARTITGESGNSVQVPYGYGLTPFILLWRMLEMTFDLAGYKVAENVFTLPPYNDITVLNNCVDSCVTNKLNYSDLVPSITVGELMIWLKDKFGAYICLDRDKKVRICLLSHLIDEEKGSADIDLSEFSDPKSEQIAYPVSRSLEIDCDKGLEGAAPPQDVSVEDYVELYNGRVFSMPMSPFLEPTCPYGTEGRIYEPAVIDFYRDEVVSCERVYSEFVVQCSSAPIARLGSTAFKYARKGNHEKMSLKTEDKYCPQQADMVYIGDAIHNHTSLNEKQELATKQAIIVCRRHSYLTETPRQYGGYSIRVGAESITLSMAPDGIYHDFWRRYNQMLISAAPEITVSAEYPLHKILGIDFSKRKLYNNQNVILKTLSLTISAQGVSFGDTVLQSIPNYISEIPDRDALDPNCLIWKPVSNMPILLRNRSDVAYIGREYEYSMADAPTFEPAVIGQLGKLRIVGGYIESDGPEAQRYWWTEMFVAVFKD